MFSKKLTFLFFFFFIVLMVSSVKADYEVLITFSEDTYLRQEAPNTDYSSYTYMDCGIIGASYYRTYSVLLLNQSDLTDIINLYDLGFLDGKQFYIRTYSYLTTSSPSYDMKIDVHRINAEFDASGLTWNNKPTYEATNCSYYFVDGDNSGADFHYLNITDDFLDVLDNDGADFGGYLLKDAYGNTIKQQFHSQSLEATYDPVIVWGEGAVSDEDTTTYVDAEELSQVLMLLLIIFLPAFAFAGALATSRETQALVPMGFIVGAIIGVVVGVLAGVIPSWAVIFIGLGIVALLWSMRR